MKKLLLTLGTATAVVAPLTTVVACSKKLSFNLGTEKGIQKYADEVAKAVANKSYKAEWKITNASGSTKTFKVTHDNLLEMQVQINAFIGAQIA